MSSASKTSTSKTSTSKSSMTPSTQLPYSAQISPNIHDPSTAAVTNLRGANASLVAHRNSSAANNLSRKARSQSRANQPVNFAVTEEGGSTFLVGSSQHIISSDHLIPRTIYNHLTQLVVSLTEEEINTISKKYVTSPYFKEIKKYSNNMSDQNRAYNSEHIMNLSIGLSEYLNEMLPRTVQSELTNKTNLEELTKEALIQAIDDLQFQKQHLICKNILDIHAKLTNIILPALTGYQTLLSHLNTLLKEKSLLRSVFEEMIKSENIARLETKIPELINIFSAY